MIKFSSTAANSVFGGRLWPRAACVRCKCDVGSFVRKQEFLQAFVVLLRKCSDVRFGEGWQVLQNFPMSGKGFLG